MELRDGDDGEEEKFKDAVLARDRETEGIIVREREGGRARDTNQREFTPKGEGHSTRS